MRCAIIADIHGNLTAFKAILKDIEQQGEVEKLWCLGDIVGYGPDPHECIELLSNTNHTCVAGNHDLAAIGKVSISRFNPDAAIACNWTARYLTPDDIEYLENLPTIIEEDDFTLVHGSPREPIWEYITSTAVARENFSYFKTKYCLIGHSHIPLVFSHSEGGEYTSTGFNPSISLALGKSKLIINPGGVGQPRDGDPRASYAIYDSETNQIKLYRVDYDVRSTQDRMVTAGLPLRLVVRLSQGL